MSYINKDPYYKSALDFYKNFELIKKAGFIEETISDKKRESINNPLWLTTPFNKIKTQPDKKNIVLLLTGSFAPLHQGHIHIMEKAKQELENRDCHINIAGGYISPSHDNYVLEKAESIKEQKLNAFKRCEIIREAINEHAWLMCDPWESIYNQEPINFTTVITRLKNYLNYHFKCDIEIYFVYGSDNIDFSYAFVKKSKGVCIERPGYPLLIEKINDNVLFIENKKFDLSSTKIRKKHQEDNLVKEYSYYIIRDDFELSTQNLLMKNENAQKDNLFKIIQEAFSQKCLLIDIEKQIELVKPEVNEKAISLDLYSKAQKNIDLCRLFPLSDYQKYSTSYTHRKRDLEIDICSEDLFQYNSKNCFIIDDDTASGATKEKITNLCKKNNINIEKFIFLNEIYLEYLGIESNLILDIVDIRDFILGATMGGLCVSLPNRKKARFIYTLPYVNLSTRMKMDLEKQIDFSKKIWQWNFEFYKDRSKKVKDLCPLTQAGLNYIGFDNKDNVANVCLWHLDKMESL